jgi:hypothetical protein
MQPSQLFNLAFSYTPSHVGILGYRGDEPPGAGAAFLAPAAPPRDRSVVSRSVLRGGGNRRGHRDADDPVLLAASLRFVARVPVVHPEGLVQHGPTQGGIAEQTGFAITQVLVKIPLWGPRLRRFNRYAEHVTPDGLRDGIVWPADQTTGHAMNAADFEYALARRVMPELHAGLSSLLRHQAGRNPALQISVPDRLLAFFIMPFPGRITYANLPIPTLSVVAERMRKPLGLTLTFDTRLHRFMPMAFDVFIAEVLGPDTDVTIEERSAPNTVGGSFIRLRGSNAKDLITVAEAFYDRAWQAEAEASEQQLAHTIAVILEQLQSMRDYWSGLAVANPDVQEMFTDQATAHIRRKDREILTTPTQRIASALIEEAKTRLGKALTSAGEGLVRGALPSGE